MIPLITCTNHCMKAAFPPIKLAYRSQKHSSWILTWRSPRNPYADDAHLLRQYYSDLKQWPWTPRCAHFLVSTLMHSFLHRISHHKRCAHFHAPKAEPPAFRAARSPSSRRSRSQNLLKPTVSRASTVFELPPAPMESKRAVAVLLVVLVAAVAVSTGGVDGARRVVEWPESLVAADSDPKTTTTTTAACLMARLASGPNPKGPGH